MYKQLEMVSNSSTKNARDLKIVNVVVSGKLNQRLHLSTLVKNCNNLTYDPELYYGGHLKLSSNTVTLYESGNYIIPGIKSVKDVETVWNEFSTFMSIYYDNTLFEKPQIRNIVAIITLPLSLNLETIYKKFNQEAVSYNPCVFPALKWKMKQGTALMFSSGKIVLTGAHSEADINQLSDFICCMLNRSCGILF